MFGSRQSLTLRRRTLLAALIVASLAVLFTSRGPDSLPRAQAQTPGIHYSAGWNLVAVPTGTVLDQAAGTQYILRPTSTDYQPISRNGITGGRSLWAYFPQDATVTVGTTAADFTRLILPPDKFAMIGNPSTTQTLPLHGADVALAYDVQAGYQPVTELRPGQGAFVLSHQGGDVVVGTVPAGAESIRPLQMGLTQDASDVSNFAKLPGVSEKLLNNRQYDAVQAGMDDVNSAFADGLVSEHATTPPQLTDDERNNAVGVRQDLATAQTASAAGNNASADAAVTDARQKAQASEDQAATNARAQATTGTAALRGSLVRYSAATAYTSDSLARYGTLCTATTPALGLNLPPTTQFVGLVMAVLNNQPPPPAAGPTPAS